MSIHNEAESVQGKWSMVGQLWRWRIERLVLLAGSNLFCDKDGRLVMYCRYSGREFEDIREERGWSKEKAFRESRKIHKRLIGRHVPARAILDYGLANPFMTEDARKCLINDYNRNIKFKFQPKPKGQHNGS